MNDLESERKLEEAKKNVKENGYYLKKALENSSMRDALKHANSMLAEMKTGDLTPRDYYALYMQIFDELRMLESYLTDEYPKRNKKLVELYESVQQASSIVPRLYLMITAGSACIQLKEANSQVVLQDLLEMLKGVQHPLRGLFIRYYFLKMSKDRFDNSEAENLDHETAVKLLISNLDEMNRLWMRINPGDKDRKKKEKLRLELKVTVGENVVRLASLEQSTVENYSTEVLPKLLETVFPLNSPFYWPV